MNQWAKFVTSRSRDAAMYGVYRYAFSRLLSVGVVYRITFVDTAATCPVPSAATPCNDSLSRGCPQQTQVSRGRQTSTSISLAPHSDRMPVEGMKGRIGKVELHTTVVASNSSVSLAGKCSLKSPPPRPHPTTM